MVKEERTYSDGCSWVIATSYSAAGPVVEASDGSLDHWCWKVGIFEITSP